jgi:hypothetical protein
LEASSSLPRDLAGGIRTDRLSRSDHETWRAIIRIVNAADRDGRPLHPALRALWDHVDSSRHTLFVEIHRSKGASSYVAGRFEVTSVDPEGGAHQGRLILNLRVIDRASTGAGAARPDGFIPFAGLGKVERYAEVLAHELAHAAWHFADPERARLAARLQGALEELVRRRSAAWARGLVEPDADLAHVEGLALDQEAVAEAAERAVWKELRSGRQRQVLGAGH